MYPACHTQQEPFLVKVIMKQKNYCVKLKATFFGFIYFILFFFFEDVIIATKNKMILAILSLKLTGEKSQKFHLISGK